VEAKDASLAEDVPGPEHSHEEVHHRRSERKESSCSHQNYKISRPTGNSNETFNKIKTRIILNGRSHFWLLIQFQTKKLYCLQKKYFNKINSYFLGYDGQTKARSSPTCGQPDGC
jgi:hypothetical protein